MSPLPMRWSFLAALFVVAACRPSPADVVTTEMPQAARPRTVMVHLFEWRWEDVARECELVLGPAGYAAVQVSPPQEHVVLQSAPWWQRYQPVSYALESRSGNRQAFASMVARCKAVGVDIYVDAVMNHMAGFGRGTGSAGTHFTKYGYPGLYEANHFHPCRRAITNWGSREEMQACELASCADLDTSQPDVQAKIAAYLEDLTGLGVAGIRVDAAKHIALSELTAILARVSRPLYVYQEVIDGEPIRATEYMGAGDVTEFRYGSDLSRVFRTGRLAWLDRFGEPWGYLPSHAAIAFIDNHDNQRGHGSGDPLTHRDPELYRLAQIFMLAWPYGYPQIMSSYAFTGPSDGPPSNAGQTLPAIDPGGACAAGWICEHRWPAVRGMVGFRNVTSASFATTDFWTDGNNQIAFGRGRLGFVAINREPSAPLEQTLRTSLAPGTYCDVVTGERAEKGCTGAEILVRENGMISASLGPLSAFAIHVESRR
jgi:alpha-amylase